MPKTISQTNTTALFGAGMAAQAILDAGIYVDNQFELSGKRRNFIEIELFEGLKCSIARQGDNGLSAKYHGVTPSDVITDKQNLKPLRNLKIFCENESLGDYGYFVPKLVPRPAKGNPKYISQDNLVDSLHDQNYFCMSVVGNLSNLQKLGYIDGSVNISDDVIFKLGDIGCEKIEVFPIHNKSGTFFPAIYMKNSMVYYRPVYLKEVEIDFSKRLLDMKSMNIKLFLEKILCSLFLKYGVHLIKPIKWEVYAQHNLAVAYMLDKNGIHPNVYAQQELYSARSELFEATRKIHPSLRKSKFRFFNGIHLSYDRKVLQNTPSNIQVLDTSLCRSKGYHPTIEMYCKVFNKYA